MEGQVPPEPFPWKQVGACCAVLFANSAGSLVIFPFMTFQVNGFFPDRSRAELGGKVGLLASSYFMGQLAGSGIWGRLSDVFGRRACTLVGLVSSCLCIVLYGLAPTFWAAFAARFMWGLLNGIIGIGKAYLADVLPEEHMARGFSAIGVAAGLGRLVGPLLGGTLAQPAGWMPDVFGGTVFDSHEYLLPCAGGAVVQLAALGLSWSHMTETSEMASARRLRSAKEAVGQGGIAAAICGEVGRIRQALASSSTGVPALLYAIHALPAILSQEVSSLWAVNSPTLGGLCFSSGEIGSAIMVNAVALLVFQTAAYPRLAAQHGCTKLVMQALVHFGAANALLPCVGWLAPAGLDTCDGGSLGWTPWVGFALVTTWMTLARVCAFTTIFVLIGNSALPDERGTVNGAAQTLVALVRVVGPVVGGRIFEWSVSSLRPWPLNSALSWYLIALMTVGTHHWCTRLPPGADRKRG